MNPDRSVLALSAVLLQRLQRVRSDNYSALLQHALQQTPDGDTLFPGALSLLYLLGLVEYHPRADTFEYIGP